MSIFHRTIEIDIAELDKGLFAVKTNLADMFHDIELTLYITIPDFIISRAEVEMRNIPHKDCRLIYPVIQALSGVQVGAGFTRRVLELLGGEKGCPNLVNLLLLSAPLTMNAAVVLRAKEENMTREEVDQLLHELLSGVCIAYTRI